MRLLLLLLLALPVSAGQLTVAPQQIVDQARAALGPLGPGQALEPTNKLSPATVDDGQLGWQSTVVQGLDVDVPRVRVALQIDGQVRRTWLISFKKKRSVQVLVAARALPRGQRLSGADVSVETRAMGSGDTWLSSPEELDGLELRRNIPPGEPLRQGDLARAVLLPAGQNVTITLHQEGLLIRMAGRTLDPALAKQPFRVRTASGTVLSATLSPDGEVVCTTR